MTRETDANSVRRSWTKTENYRGNHWDLIRQVKGFEKPVPVFRALRMKD